jgi:hypothetical protein
MQEKPPSWLESHWHDAKGNWKFQLFWDYGRPTLLAIASWIYGKSTTMNYGELIGGAGMVAGIGWGMISAFRYFRSRKSEKRLPLEVSAEHTPHTHGVRVSYEEQTKIDEILKGVPQVKIAVTTYSTNFSKVLGDDTEGAYWFNEALRKAGAVTEIALWQSFGAVPDGANIWWVKSAQNDDVVRRLRESALIKGFVLQEAPRGITNGFDIEIMVGRRCQQGPLSESVQRGERGSIQTEGIGAQGKARKTSKKDNYVGSRDRNVKSPYTISHRSGRNLHADGGWRRLCDSTREDI